jgi:translation initiation factor 4E|mmetsp:Transcript_61220/g.101174  ORF Transcript_61220/g.101174 Transcript_61220/m.101174 type:complete len:209 (-) Transcript_61220:1600-2226(-)|eukprot:CAMPEP_0174285436 /NCGR_PEP_ID=MMETSP0809-20121228/8800_1 /TAXON_ID=73025 ORGANISM="Eutreptiella gymnastica-like, Strain CCMP1594" /NCGR_SAMPLE_ID=MMETSP0809 /ASSEMBLY_ACC=CAM_ASM_000658 /LENGTH=208 /DNA_ID=CAMNT_0015381225 /DNA_START=38 /DNA_END=664 /DNA_ORIENTATION=+
MATDAAPLTVDMNDKHPLENTWVIWYDSRRLHQQNPNDWFGNLQTVAIFSTVEDFWSTYNHIKRPNDLEFGANYHMFKHGVKPMWEDSANEKGGKWVMTLQKEDASRMDDLWELLLLSMIGEYLDDGAGDNSKDGHSQICGAVLSRRKAGPRISVWTRDRENTQALKNIGQRLRSILKLSDKTPLEYQSHADSIATGTSYKNESRLTC